MTARRRTLIPSTSSRRTPRAEALPLLVWGEREIFVMTYVCQRLINCQRVRSTKSTVPIIDVFQLTSAVNPGLPRKSASLPESPDAVLTNRGYAVLTNRLAGSKISPALAGSEFRPASTQSPPPSLPLDPIPALSCRSCSTCCRMSRNWSVTCRVAKHAVLASISPAHSRAST